MASLFHARAVEVQNHQTVERRALLFRLWPAGLLSRDFYSPACSDRLHSLLSRIVFASNLSRAPNRSAVSVGVGAPPERRVRTLEDAVLIPFSLFALWHVSSRMTAWFPHSPGAVSTAPTAQAQSETIVSSSYVTRPISSTGKPSSSEIASMTYPWIKSRVR